MRVHHYPNCEKATSRTCRCAWCAGTRHGWMGATVLATHQDPTEYERFCNRAEDQWRDECAKRDSRPNKRPTFKHKAAAIDLCRADLIAWLRKDRSDKKALGKGPEDKSQGQRGSQQEVQQESSRHSGEDRGTEKLDSPAVDQILTRGAAPGAIETQAASDGHDGFELGLDLAVVDQVQQLGDALLNDVLKEIEKECGRSISDSEKKGYGRSFLVRNTGAACACRF